MGSAASLPAGNLLLYQDSKLLKSPANAAAVNDIGLKVTTFPDLDWNRMTGLLDYPRVDGFGFSVKKNVLSWLRSWLILPFLW